MRIANLVLGAALILSPLDAIAVSAPDSDVTVYDCAMGLSPDTGYWIAPEYLIAVERAAKLGQFGPVGGRVMITDAIIQKFVGQPLTVETKQTGAGATSFGWSFTAKDRAGTIGRLYYTATLFPQSGVIHMKLLVHPGGQGALSEGTCKVSELAEFNAPFPPFVVPWNYLF